MLPISELEVTQYRGLRDFSLKGLGRVNLLVGENNSGKTSALEAISLAASPLDPWVWMRVASRREPLSWLTYRSVSERLRWLFPQHASKGPDASYDGRIKLSIAGRSPLRAMEARYQALRSAIEAAPALLRDERSTGDRPERSGERRGAKIDIETVIEPAPGDERSGTRTRESFTWWEGERFVSEEKIRPAFDAQTITPYDHWFGELPASLYSEARVEGNGETTQDVVQLLSRIDSRIVGLEVLAARSEAEAHPAPAVLYLRDRSAGLLPIDAFGDGMRRILLMALGVTRARGGALLIDEIETAIHISALGHVFRWIVEACVTNDVQLFATTHSLEAIDAILAADTTPEEDIVGYRLELKGTRVVTHRYSEDLLKRLRIERGADVR
jgi:hypothetical protein